MPLNPQAQAFVHTIAETNPPGWDQLSPSAGREIFNGFSDRFGNGPELARVEDRILDGHLKTRVYSNVTAGGQPAVMFFHGGGWVLGNIDTHDALCRRLAAESGCTVISVDYSLAPEAQFPRPLEDCYAATSYVSRCASELDIDPTRMAVAGDSAGGNLAAAVAIRARDESGPAIKLQVLIYPVIQRDFSTPSYQQFANGHGLTRAVMQWFWDQYLGDQPTVPLAAPATARSLAGLPPAHVITAEYDVLRDEGEAFARQLSAAGVPTTWRRYDGNLHGFIHLAGLFDDGLRGTSDIADVLKTHLG